MNRRSLVLAIAAGLLAPAGLLAADKDAPKKVLFFTKSSGFPHSVVMRKGGELSHAEKILTEIGKKAGFEVVCSKDGGLFESDKIGQFDAFVFETTGDLTKPGTDKTPPMTAEGEKNLYEAIKSGKGFIGFHCATDTFGHHRGRGADDPYIQMIGGEFLGHDAQQDATLGIADSGFPGAKAFGSGESFKLFDEWYSLKNLANDLHVVYFYNTAGMKGHNYERPNFPQCWARMHGKGRVFYNSMGHREQVWSDPRFQESTVAALNWATGRADADVPANVSTVTPEYATNPGPAAKKSR